MISVDDIFPKDYPDFSEHGEPKCSVAPDIFFPAEKIKTVGSNSGVTGSYYTNEEEAKVLCKMCPYKEACLEFALANHQRGIWGGTTEHERNKMVRFRIINARAF